MRSTVMLDAAVAIRRRQFDPQLRTVAGAQRNGEESQQGKFPTTMRRRRVAWKQQADREAQRLLSAPHASVGQTQPADDPTRPGASPRTPEVKIEKIR